MLIGSDLMIKNDIRRVQQTGGGRGSLVISLPRDYCEANGITVGTAIRMTEEPAGLLLSKVI